MELSVKGANKGPVIGEVFYAKNVGSGPEGLYFNTEDGIFLLEAAVPASGMGTSNPRRPSMSKKWSFGPTIIGYAPVKKLEAIL